jgi:hypothetical protein
MKTNALQEGIGTEKNILRLLSGLIRKTEKHYACGRNLDGNSLNGGVLCE